MRTSPYGSKGSERHQALITWATVTPYGIADDLGVFCFVTTSEDGDSTMARLLKTCGNGFDKPQQGGPVRLGGYYPDLVWEFGDQVFAIEVGEYEPDRAPECLSVFHIAYNGKVSIINPTRENFNLMIVIAEKLRQIMEVASERN